MKDKQGNKDAVVPPGKKMITHAEEQVADSIRRAGKVKPSSAPGAPFGKGADR